MDVKTLEGEWQATSEKRKRNEYGAKSDSLIDKHETNFHVFLLQTKNRIEKSFKAKRRREWSQKSVQKQSHISQQLFKSYSHVAGE